MTKTAALVITSKIFNKDLMDKVDSTIQNEIGNSNVKYKGVTVAEGVEEIGFETFKNKDIRKFFNRSSKLKSIKDSAFQNSNLIFKDLDWKNYPHKSVANRLNDNIGLESIGREGFADNSSLRSVTLPSTLTSVGDYAFAACNIQNTLVSENLRLPSNAFVKNPNNTISYIESTFKRTDGNQMRINKNIGL